MADKKLPTAQLKLIWPRVMDEMLAFNNSINVSNAKRGYALLTLIRTTNHGSTAS